MGTEQTYLYEIPEKSDLIAFFNYKDKHFSLTTSQILR